MSIKLVAIDIDGTLLNSQHQITAEVHSAIQESKKQALKLLLLLVAPFPVFKQF